MLTHWYSIICTSSFAIICFLYLGCLCYFLCSVYMSSVFAIYYMCDYLPFVYPLYVRTFVYAASSVCLLSVYCTHSELSVYLIPVACLFVFCFISVSLNFAVYLPTMSCMLTFYLYYYISSMSVCYLSVVFPHFVSSWYNVWLLLSLFCFSDIYLSVICCTSDMCLFYCLLVLSVICLPVSLPLSELLSTLYLSSVCLYAICMSVVYVSALYLSILSGIYCLCRVDIILENK